MRQAKKSNREARDESDSVFSKKNHGCGNTDDSLRIDCPGGELADGKLNQEGCGGKAMKKLSGAPNLIANKVEADGDLRCKFCTGESGSDKTQVVSLNGSPKPLRTPVARRSGRECVFCKHRDYWTIQYEGEVAWLKATRGLQCIVCLLGQPGREFHVRELMSPVAPATELNQWRVQEDG